MFDVCSLCMWLRIVIFMCANVSGHDDGGDDGGVDGGGDDMCACMRPKRCTGYFEVSVVVVCNVFFVFS